MSTRRLLLFCLILFGAGFALAFWFPAFWRSPSTPGPPPGAERAPPWDAALGSEPRFTEVTAASGVDFRHENGLSGECVYLEIMGGGVGLFDYDGDGDLDLYLVNGNKLFEKALPTISDRLYRNEGGFRFKDVTAQAGLLESAYGQGCCAGDYDRDGDLDLFVSNYGPDVLHRNNGDGTFTDVTGRAGVGDPGWGQSSAFLDFDGDGWLDLYVQNYLDPAAARSGGNFILVGREKVTDYPSPMGFRGSSSRLYRNQGDGSFRDVTEAAGLFRPEGKGMGVGIADFNDDGRVDIFVANDSAENFFFVNLGGGRFEERALLAGVAVDENGVAEASMGVDVGDYDGDERLDLVVPCLKRQVFSLYRNKGGEFTDVSVAAGLAGPTAPFTGFDAHFLDHDQDGDLDLFFANGGVRRNEDAPPGASYQESYGQEDQLLVNDGRGRFVEASARAGSWFRERRISRGSAVGDLDGDGDLDLVVSVLADRPVLLRNDTPAAGHWLILELVDARGQLSPLGARVRLEAGGRRRRADVHSAVSYLSQSDRRLHFGLGSAASVDSLEVRWPDGTGERRERLPVDRVLRLRQGEPPR